MKIDTNRTHHGCFIYTMSEERSLLFAGFGAGPEQTSREHITAISSTVLGALHLNPAELALLVGVVSEKEGQQTPKKLNYSAKPYQEEERKSRDFG